MFTNSWFIIYWFVRYPILFFFFLEFLVILDKYWLTFVLGQIHFKSNCIDSVVNPLNNKCTWVILNSFQFLFVEIIKRGRTKKSTQNNEKKLSNSTYDVNLLDICILFSTSRINYKSLIVYFRYSMFRPHNVRIRIRFYWVIV